MKKPNCYECKYRGTVAGSAHSCCNHPKCKKIELDGVLGLLAISGGLPPIETGLNIKANLTGIRGGWFFHPFNFDPVWLEECNGFKNKLKKRGIV